MAFGIDDIFYILAAAQAANSIANPPEGPENKVSASGSTPRATQGPNAFALPVPGSKAEAPSPVAIDDELFTAAAEQAARVTGGPPPTVPLQAPVGPPQDTNAGTLPPQPGAAPQQAPPPGIGEVLAASPQAIASVANLLGLGQAQPEGERPAPVPGGTAGNLVQGFNLPQNMNVGSILSQIPRFR